MSTPGLRNNNPGNLRETNTLWRGQAGSDDGFCRFTSSLWGLRAIAVTLRTYAARRECAQTVRGIIGRWAPRTENETGAYVQDVCERLGVDDNTPIDVDDADVCQALVKAIVWHENGSQPYPSDLIADAVARA